MNEVLDAIKAFGEGAKALANSTPQTQITFLVAVAIWRLQGIREFYTEWKIQRREDHLHELHLHRARRELNDSIAQRQAMMSNRQRRIT